MLQFSAFLTREALTFQAGLDQVGTLSFGADFLAAGFDTQGLFDRTEAKPPGDTLIENFKVIVLKLDYLAAIDTDEVIMGGFSRKLGS